MWERGVSENKIHSTHMHEDMEKHVPLCASLKKFIYNFTFQPRAQQTLESWEARVEEGRCHSTTWILKADRGPHFREIWDRAGGNQGWMGNAGWGKGAQKSSPREGSNNTVVFNYRLTTGGNGASLRGNRVQAELVCLGGFRMPSGSPCALLS